MRARASSLLLLTLACGGSAVPALTADSLTTPRLEQLTPRDITLKVTDDRPITEAERRETEAHLEAVLAQLFRAANFSVNGSSSNVLTIVLDLPRSTAGFDPESCVELTTELRPARDGVLSVTSMGCAETKHLLFGISMGAQLDAAFEQAVNTMLRQLEGQLFALDTMKAPPRFEASQISVPAFKSLTSRALALEVRDQWSSDGTLAPHLQQELTLALRRKALDVTPQARQKLLVTLRKPDQDPQGRSRDTCVEVQLRASFTRGSAFSHSVGCRGLEESVHHRILNETLHVLDAEYTKAFGP